MSFSIGDVVVHKSGGLVMVVVLRNEREGKVTCCWTGQAGAQMDEFQESCLRIWRPRD